MSQLRLTPARSLNSPSVLSPSGPLRVCGKGPHPNFEVSLHQVHKVLASRWQFIPASAFDEGLNFRQVSFVTGAEVSTWGEQGLKRDVQRLLTLTTLARPG